MRTFRNCVIAAAIILLAASAAAQQLKRAEASGYVVPLAAIADSSPKHLMPCADPWVKMVPDGSDAWAATWYKEAWHCIPRDYSCFREGEAGAGYGCKGGKLKGLLVTADTGNVRAQLAAKPAPSPANLPPECAIWIHEAGLELTELGYQTQVLSDAIPYQRGERYVLAEDVVDYAEQATHTLDTAWRGYLLMIEALECIVPGLFPPETLTTLRGGTQ